jgi:hypothetical protein
MGTNRTKVDDLMPIICKLYKRLSGISNTLHYSSILVTVKAIIFTTPNFAICALKVHYTCLDHVEKSFRSLFWHGKDINKCGECLVKWDTSPLLARMGFSSTLLD